MNWKAFWRSSRSTIISAVIALVVIVGLFVLFNALPASQKPKPASEQPKQEQQKTQTNKQTEQPKETKPTLPATYTVVRGDSLWKIATRFYGTGYNWVMIAQENKLANPSTIHAGNVLTIPKTGVQERTYTVVRGDSLWTIAQRYYGSGYEWFKIRDANAGKVGTLSNGRPLITPGQVLAIP